MLSDAKEIGKKVVAAIGSHLNKIARLAGNRGRKFTLR
jgi:hypothetical protein